MAAIDRVAIIVLDSLGIGALPDAHQYGDEGSNTLGNLSRAVGGVSLPNLADLGLANLVEIAGTPARPRDKLVGAHTVIHPRSPGKDTIAGHWEIGGVVLDKPIKTYPTGFPPEVIEAFTAAIGRPILGNVAASGTVIIEELGAEHMRTGHPIVYTSADSVFQIAAHEEIIPVEELYRMCAIARQICTGANTVGRVIARPFLGQPGSFHRTERRKDFSLAPPAPTLLDQVSQAGLEVIAIGKIYDIFDGRGATAHRKTRDNREGMQQTLEVLRRKEWRGLVFANLVDFDQRYGHRNDPRGYAEALREFDAFLPRLRATLGQRDLLIITADHGCDPTTPSTDHSRESVPWLTTGPGVRPHRLADRDTLADIGATVAELLGVEYQGAGVSLAAELLQ